MDNQHQKIKGYRELNETEITVMNDIKETGEALGALCDTLAAQPSSVVDQRWIAIGRTHLQQGIMALVRAVAKPTTF